QLPIAECRVDEHVRFTEVGPLLIPRLLTLHLCARRACGLAQVQTLQCQGHVAKKRVGRARLDVGAAQYQLPAAFDVDRLTTSPRLHSVDGDMGSLIEGRRYDVESDVLEFEADALDVRPPTAQVCKPGGDRAPSAVFGVFPPIQRDVGVQLTFEA